MNTVKAWIFDLDGVVTSLKQKRITNPHIVSVMVTLLQKEEPVTINTGRSLAFIREEILTPLIDHLNLYNLPHSLLRNFFAVGEKGNAWIEDQQDSFDVSTAVPQELFNKAESLIENNYPDILFDTTKHTMVSVESKRGASLTEFAVEKEKIITEFQKYLEEFHLTDNFHLDPSVSAVDIEHKTAGKAKGTERIIAWLDKKGITPAQYIAFGDSNMDIGMGEALSRAQKNFIFVFVGDPKVIKTQPSFPVMFTREQYAKGVIEYFSHLTNL